MIDLTPGELLAGNFEQLEIFIISRLPRLLAILCTGIGMSVAGLIMQQLCSIDTFFSALEHVLTLLYPFTDNFSAGKSYYSNCIRNTKWHWEKKLQDVCGSSMPNKITSALRRIKEVYRNHNTHGGFSREMMAYVQIPNFGRFPMYVGKEYLRGFVDGCLDTISYEMYCDAKKVFSGFWDILDTVYEIPMLFVRSGLPISVDTERYTKNIDSVE